MRIEEKFSFTWSGNLETGRVQCIIAGLHVEISRHKKVLYLNVFSWGLLLNNSEKIQYTIEQSSSLKGLAQSKKNRCIPQDTLVADHVFSNLAQGKSTRNPKIMQAGEDPSNILWFSGRLHKVSAKNEISLCKGVRK